MFLVRTMENRKTYRVGVSDVESVATFDDIFENEMEEQIRKVR